MPTTNLIYLVHGSSAHTWWRRMANKGYPWWRRWSLFSRELREAFNDNCEIREFRWSGDNVHQARLDAGKALAKLLERAHPETDLHVVGHSHGGNVALVAANHLASRRMQSLILLANPHMAIRRVGEDKTEWLYWGEAEHRVERLWNLYSPEDRVQDGLARRFHGIPKVPSSAVAVQRVAPSSSAATGAASFDGAIHWKPAGAAHSALHSRAMGKVVGALMRGQTFESAMANAGLSLDQPNTAKDRGGFPGIEATQALIRSRGDARPFDLGSGNVGLLLVHGFTSSPAEMRPLAEALTQHSGWRCKGIVLPGHGAALEDLQQARGEDWITAVERAAAALAEESEHVFLCGLSLGAALVCHAALRRKAQSRLRGILLIAPAFGVSLKREIGVTLVRPFSNLRNKGTRASDYFLDHRLCSHLHTPLNLVSDVLRLGRDAVAHLGQLRDIPTILFVGDLETTVSLDKILAAARANPWIRLVRMPRSRHILTVEPDRETLFETSARFVEECLKMNGKS